MGLLDGPVAQSVLSLRLKGIVGNLQSSYLVGVALLCLGLFEAINARHLRTEPLIFCVSRLARVRVTVWAKDGARSIVREGCGAARGFARTVAEAMENAIKAAETGAMKRALVYLRRPVRAHPL
jgi:hypothetical protein